MKNQALSSLELPENVITYHMISIEKDTIAAITNSNSGVICSQGHYHKTCPSNSKLFHSFIIICETTYIKLRKKEDQLYQQQQQINHTTPTSLKTWDFTTYRITSRSQEKTVKIWTNRKHHSRQCCGRNKSQLPRFSFFKFDSIAASIIWAAAKTTA